MLTANISAPSASVNILILITAEFMMKRQSAGEQSGDTNHNIIGSDCDASTPLARELCDILEEKELLILYYVRD